MNTEALKQQAAEQALTYIQDDMIVGVGTGSTTNYFINALSQIKDRIAGAVASSEATAQRLRAHQIAIIDLNSVVSVPIYVDGADACNGHLELIKGRGGAMTQEKVLASASEQFICIIDASKWDNDFTTCPLPVEVLAMARSFVARQIVKLGGIPSLRANTYTDNHHLILDVMGFDFKDPLALEQDLNNIPGVVGHGLFVSRKPDLVICATPQGIRSYP